MTYTDRTSADRLAVVVREIDNLAANMLTGVLNPTLLKLLAERAAEKTRLESQIAGQPATSRPATILPHSALIRLFEDKVGRLREALDDEPVRGEAAEIIATLIESVTIYPDGGRGPEAEVVARVTDLMAFADKRRCRP